MRIAQVSPLHESVPPKLYGGTERVVSYCTEELVRRGHQVTLFGSGDSITAAQLRAACPVALRQEQTIADGLPHHLVMLEQVARLSSDFDIIHFHTSYLHFPLTRRISTPHLTTLHGRLDLPEIFPLFQEFRKAPLTSISNAQRRPLPCANWQATVYHGLPPHFEFHEGPNSYLAFLGRISPEKRPDLAIEIACRAGLPLKIAAKIDRVDVEYYETRIKPLLNSPLVEFVGEIGEHEKNEFLGNALALLFPIDWPEPFGLVLIEAMACGTPVIAFNAGSVPEIVEQGVTGFVVENTDQAVRAAEQIFALERRQCRQHFEKYYSADCMVSNYELVYERILSGTVTETAYERSHTNQGPVLRPINLPISGPAPSSAQAG